MAEQFSKSVQLGLTLSKRIYLGKSPSVSAPKEMVMEKSVLKLPTGPMVYAVIIDPGTVDNCDIPSYQPHVYGRCNPPALIPLHMHGIEMEVNCYLDTAFVSLTGSWRVHCVSGGSSCDCRIAIPMGDQGSILGLNVDVAGRSYSTQLIFMEEKIDVIKELKARDGGFLTPQIFTLTIPQVDGGSNILVKVSWCQKLLYTSGHFFVCLPFSFPEYVNPTESTASRREKIQLNVNSGTGLELIWKTSSHPLKEIKCQVGELGFSYESDVLTWSASDFNFSYKISSTDIFGGVILQSPAAREFDQREMFCLYLLPGDNQSPKVFTKNVIFLVDISGSMKGRLLEHVKNAIYAALLELNSEDSFSVIAFNGEIFKFSSSLEQATNETIESATEWIRVNFIAKGGTNILLALNQAIEMLPVTGDSVPHIFLITDGAVEDERDICDIVKGYLTNRGPMFPRISTVGIGMYCNHYFLQMLALTSRGHYVAACGSDSVDLQIQRLLTTASSPILANITVDGLQHLDACEVYPPVIPDLLSGKPCIISGRYKGKFPNFLTVTGTLGDKNPLRVELKVQNAKGIPLDKVVAGQQIDVVTAQAWFSENKQLVEKVAQISIQSGFTSEYTRMVVLMPIGGKRAFITQEVLNKINQKKPVEPKGHTMVLLQSLGTGFGDITATKENIPTGFRELSLPDPAPGALAKAASTCCGRLGNTCCCMCFIQTCSKTSDQCAIVLAQLCSALSCFGCLSCCAELCLD